MPSTLFEKILRVFLSWRSSSWGVTGAWPNADEYRNLVLIVTSAVIVIPIYFLIIAGVWDRHRDARALVLLAGPMLYFCAIHLVFVSSIRYRIPGEMAATASLELVLRRSYAGLGSSLTVYRQSTPCVDIRIECSRNSWIGV